ncbi:HD domain-containing protein [Candidatus Roizmanbacteria bacterium]|nr:HD domain-containing protein [Candidatus Roizmanbacteria bacterium]
MIKDEKLLSKQIVDFMILAGKLKWLKRSGWLNHMMPEPESVAEHTYRVAILSRILAKMLGLNEEKLTVMAIFHDLAEGVLGDPIFQRGRRQIRTPNWADEKKLMKQVSSDLGMPDLYVIWEENILENGPKKTDYSDALYQIGKLANVWQALEYELRGVPREKTNEFWENASYQITIPILRRILNTLKQLRKTYKI